RGPIIYARAPRVVARGAALRGRDRVLQSESAARSSSTQANPGEIMKRLVKRGLKVLWRGTEPLRRPIIQRLELFLRRCLQPMEQGLSQETDVLMDHVVRELVRLQCQVEAMQQVLLDFVAAQTQEA